MKVQILCEDSHGKLFFNNLVKRFKERNILPRIGVAVKDLPKLCNKKLRE
ncbi:MAG: hypothetical protein ACFE9R_01465 [Candidatus Hermodarchaeota archaeon]